MKEFFEHLKKLIEASGKFGNVMMHNEIPEKVRKGEHRMQKKRSVYIEFIVEEVMHKSLGVNEFEMTVRFILANDNKKFSKTDDMVWLDVLNGVIQNESGGVENVFQFSTMSRSSFEYDTDHDQVSESVTEYTTKLTDYSGYKYRGLREGTFTELDVQVDIVDEIIVEEEDC